MKWISYSPTLLLLASAPALGGSVVVFETAGPNGKNAAKNIEAQLSEALPDHTVKQAPRPKAWKTVDVRMAGQVGEAAAAAGDDVGVASLVAKKGRKVRLVILAVTSDGRVVFDKGADLPRKQPEKRVVALAQDLAKALGKVLRSLDESASASVGSDELQDSAVDSSPRSTRTGATTELEATEVSGQSGASALLDDSTSLGDKEEEADELVRPSRRRRSSFHAAVGGMVGGLTFQDSISTPVQGGDLKIGVGVTLLTGASLELAMADWLTFSATFRSYGVAIDHEFNGDDPNTAIEEPTVTPPEINASAIGVTALLGTGMEFGPLIGGVVAGVSYDSMTADKQTLTASTGEQGVALVPSWTRLAAIAGITLNRGNLGTKGFTGQFGLLAVPWAMHSESPLTSGSSASTLGVQTWLRGRYHLNDFFGRAGGIYFEARVDLEYLSLSYSGVGTRRAFGSGDPVKSSSESRISVGGVAGVGYVY